MKMREIIRFAWGVSSLGDFMVAKSDKGLVAVSARAAPLWRTHCAYASRRPTL